MVTVRGVEVQARPDGMSTVVTGYVEGDRVIELSNRTGEWKVESSKPVPEGLPAAAKYLEAFAACMARAKEYGAEF